MPKALAAALLAALVLAGAWASGVPVLRWRDPPPPVAATPVAPGTPRWAEAVALRDARFRDPLTDLARNGTRASCYPVGGGRFGCVLRLGRALRTVLVPG